MTSSTCPHCGTTISDPTLEECQFCRRRLTGSTGTRAGGNQPSDNGTYNPFQAPQSDSDHSDVDTDDLIIRVDGDQLVVKSGAVLPPYCVKTNEPLELSRMRRKTLIWSPQYLGLLILIHVLLYVIVYYIMRKLCVISFGVGATHAAKIRNRLLVKSLFVCVAIGLLILAISHGVTEWLVASVLLLMFSVAVLVIGNSPLSAKKHQNGLFWISGCSKEFLARIQQ